MSANTNLRALWLLLSEVTMAERITGVAHCAVTLAETSLAAHAQHLAALKSFGAPQAQV